MIDAATAAATAHRVATLHRWTDGQNWYGEETIFLMPDGAVLSSREGTKTVQRYYGALAPWEGHILDYMRRALPAPGTMIASPPVAEEA